MIFCLILIESIFAFFLLWNKYIIVKEEFIIINRENVGMDLSLEWHGDSPQSEIWEVTMKDRVEAGNSTVITAKPIGLSNLERAVWVTADESGITVHLSARCPWGGC